MAKTIMIQGTASNVGKSLIVAGLCRIFKQDGWRVAPFKSQNMALNSYITRAGLEMGRAQVVQAEAAGIEPDTDMNPILLKPSSDTKSQVIVQGEIFGEENAEGYYSHKRALEPKIRESFERLSGAYDIIVLEGAGSPAEINLRENDIVNMYMARLARAPVILAGDIDRGGVFASLVGTMQLFTDEEKRLVRGVLINKFRGNEAILEPGLRQLEDLIHRPVLGVIPYMRLDIDDEDSLSERFHPQRSGPGGSGDDTVLADIAVIRFSRISNFTDFNALSRLPGVRLRYVEEREALGSPDMVILPGTKNTMADLLWIRRNGLEARIKELARRGTPVFGICGGYQMLGRTLADPDHVEEGGEMEGMGLLPVSTIFKKQKLRTRVRGRFGALGGLLKGLSGMDLEGYEVHMGSSSSAAAGGEAGSNTAVPLAAIRDINAAAAAEAGSNSAGEAGFNSGSAALDGACLGNVYGGYVHGIFDGDGIAAALVKALCAAKGLDGAAALEGEMSFKAYKEKQYDILAATLRDHIDMNRIYRILEEGI